MSSGDIDQYVPVQVFIEWYGSKEPWDVTIIFMALFNVRISFSFLLRSDRGITAVSILCAWHQVQDSMHGSNNAVGGGEGGAGNTIVSVSFCV